MIEPILLASGNAHKIAEFQKILDTNILPIVGAPTTLEVPETGETFFENAKIKAQAYFEHFKRPSMADDSGLCVEALPQELGVYSARFGGEGLSDEGRAQLLLKKMENVQERKAYFVCVLCFYLNPQEIFYFEGRLAGHIHHTYQGSGGFGYDPVFIPEQSMANPVLQTLAELSEWKEKHSHRALACKHAERFFRERNCQMGQDLLSKT